MDPPRLFLYFDTLFGAQGPKVPSQVTTTFNRRAVQNRASSAFTCQTFFLEMTSQTTCPKPGDVSGCNLRVVAL